MRRVVAFAPMVLLLARYAGQGGEGTPGPASAAADALLPVIHVDQEHMQTPGHHDPEPPAYEISAGEGLVLDARGYTFRVPPALGSAVPNMIQLFIGTGRIFGRDWQSGVWRYSLNAQTLVSLYGSGPFTGFKRGQRLVLAIGYEDPSRKEGELLKFCPIWYALVNVR